MPNPEPSVPFSNANIWGLYGRQKKSFLFSTIIQSAVVALAVIAFSNPTVQQTARQVATLVMPADLLPAAHVPKPQENHGGGGGGDRSPLPASKGRLPKSALRQFTPPAAVLNNLAPKLAMEPSILAPPDVTMPSVNMANYGDPLAKLGPPSNGTGSGGGIGSGKGGGVGSGTGGGVGPGEGGGFGGGVYSVGDHGLVLPVALYKPEPKYSDDARRARLSGEVIVQLVIDQNGRPRDMRIVRSLGLGLDEEALKCVGKWRFKPGTKDGKPVAVVGEATVGFHLL
jgi:TonB family protein